MIGSTDTIYESEDNKDSFVLNGVNVSAIKSKVNDNNGYYIVNKTRSNPAEKFYIRGFMIVRNNDTGEEKTYYTDTVYKYSFNDLEN